MGNRIERWRRNSPKNRRVPEELWQEARGSAAPTPRTPCLGIEWHPPAEDALLERVVGHSQLPRHPAHAEPSSRRPPLLIELRGFSAVSHRPPEMGQ